MSNGSMYRLTLEHGFKNISQGRVPTHVTW